MEEIDEARRDMIRAITISINEPGTEDRNKEIQYLFYIKERSEYYNIIELSKFDPKRETLKTILRKFKYQKLGI